MATESYGKPRATFKSPFRRGTRSSDPAVNEANKRGTSSEDENDKAEAAANEDALGGENEVNEAQGKEAGAGENEYDMQVNDIMGHVSDSHPEVATRLHAALTKHLKGKKGGSSNDATQSSEESE